MTKFKKCFHGQDLLRFSRLVDCTPSRGYIKVGGRWRYNSSNLHARINRRVGLGAVSSFDQFWQAVRAAPIQVTP